MSFSGETDNKRRLSCRAFNKNIPGSSIEDHWDILVQCKSLDDPAKEMLNGIWLVGSDCVTVVYNRENLFDNNLLSKLLHL